MERITPVTEEGLRKLEEELHELISVRRPLISQRILEARELGDLSENAEYHDAKNEQAFIETKILQLEDRIRTAQIITDVDTSKVEVGAKVQVIDKDSGEKVEYTITGSAEADPLAFKVSNESPVGKALLGHKPGDVVQVSLPRGTMKLEIKQISAA